MHHALGAARLQLDSSVRPTFNSFVTPSRPTRVIVLPFRILRPDAETDFLAFSLPDAVAASLANLESVVVRSSLATRVTADADLRSVARHSSAETVVVGTLVRAGDQLRVSTQLVDGATGTLVWSHTDDVGLGDLFRLQNFLVDGIVAPASLVELGRLDEARTLIAELEARSGNRVPELANAVRAFMDGRHADGVRALVAQAQTVGVSDPEIGPRKAISR